MLLDLKHCGFVHLLHVKNVLFGIVHINFLETCFSCIWSLWQRLLIGQNERKQPLIALFNPPECSRSPSHYTSGPSILHFNSAYLRQLPSFHSFAQPSLFTANRLPGCLCLSSFSLSYISIDSFPRHVLSSLPVVNDVAATLGSAPFLSLSFTANLLLLPFALMIAIIF